MAPAAVQRVAKGAVSTSVSIGAGDGWAAPTPGNFLVVSANSDATVTISPAGFSAGPSIIDGNGAYGWFKVAAGTETTITATPSVSDDIVLTVCEYSGVSAFDAQNSATIASSPGGTSTNAAAVSTTAPGDLIVSFALNHAVNASLHGASPSWTNGFTNVLAANTGTGLGRDNFTCGTFVGELVAGAPGSYSTVCSWTNGYSDRQHLIVAFKAAADVVDTPFAPQVSPGRMGPGGLWQLTPAIDAPAGPVSQVADAALAITTALTTAADRAAPAAASLTIVSAFAAAANRTAPADTALAIATALAAAGTADRPATASLSTTTTLTADATPTRTGAGALSVATALSTSAPLTATAAAALATTTTLTAAADAGGGNASLPTTTTITATGTYSAGGAASLPTVTVLAATSIATRPAAAALPTVTTLTATATRTALAAATLTTVTTLTAAGARIAPVSASLSTITVLLAATTGLRPADSSLTVTVTMSAATIPGGSADASLSTVTTIATTTLRSATADASLPTVTALTAATFTVLAAALPVTTVFTSTATRSALPDASLPVLVAFAATASRVARAFADLPTATSASAGFAAFRSGAAALPIVTALAGAAEALTGIVPFGVLDGSPTRSASTEPGRLAVSATAGASLAVSGNRDADGATVALDQSAPHVTGMIG